MLAKCSSALVLAVADEPMDIRLSLYSSGVLSFPCGELSKVVQQ